MVGLTDAEVIGLIKALAKASNESAEWQQRYFEAVQVGRWLVAEREGKE